MLSPRLVPLGAFLFALPVVFAALEMVPIWSPLKLGWPIAFYYTSVTVTGAVGGMLLAGRAPRAGAAGGAVASLGALALLHFYLSFFNFVSAELVMILGTLGALPGVILYRVLAGPPPP